MTSGLIQMNVHLEVTPEATALICVGIAAAVVGLLLAVSMILYRDRRWAAIFGALAVAGAVMVVLGARMPRDRIISACADGPVSIEQVATVYDIIEVDGKLMRLRER